ncbi:MAG: type II toxin-antitoxin system HigB family toxin [Spirulinaceae cyanobacterium]
MHIITRSRLVAFWENHPDAETSLSLWYKRAATASWQNFVELRQVFPSADQVSKFTVFNIGGDKYRLVAFIDYKYQKIFIRHVLTHSDHSKDTWKKDNWYK